MTVSQSQFYHNSLVFHIKSILQEGATCLLGLVYVRAFVGGMELNRAANTVIWLREKCVVSLSLELQQIECALTHDVNVLYVTAYRTQSNPSQSNIVISQTPNLSHCWLSRQTEM